MNPAARRALDGCRRVLAEGLTTEQRAKARARLESVAAERTRPENYPNGHPYAGGWPKDGARPRLLRRQAL